MSGRPTGILGFGRFGEAFASLLERRGQPWLAWDPATVPPPGRRAAAPEDLARRCGRLLLAVPVPELPAVLAGLRPHLGPGHLVLDAGSVKALPCRWMEECLGAEVPHAGTHPLFGPVSLARADAPLRVVVCPSARHPRAARAAADWLRGLGLEVLVQEAEAHDRVMAASHALAFFLCKGLLDAGFGGPLPFSPPSFQAIARMLETVREDAGHLFQVVENLNPFAAEARERLLEALERAHGGLLSAGEGGAAGIPPLEPELVEARQGIDEVDRTLVRLLARRAELARRVGAVKARTGAPVRDPGREATVLASRRAWARGEGADPDGVEAVFREILRGSRALQGARLRARSGA